MEYYYGWSSYHHPPAIRSQDRGLASWSGMMDVATMEGLWDRTWCRRIHNLNGLPMASNTGEVENKTYLFIQGGPPSSYKWVYNF